MRLSDIMVVCKVFCMKKNVTRLFIIFMVIAAASGVGERRSYTLAFTPLAASGIDEYDAKVFNEQLRDEIEKLGVYSTLEFSDVQVRLAEQNLPNSCSDLNCAVIAGQLLGVEYFGYGSIGKVGKAYTLGMQIVEVRTGRVVRDVSEFFKGRKSAFKIKIIPELAARVCGVEYIKRK